MRPPRTSIPVASYNIVLADHELEGFVYFDVGIAVAEAIKDSLSSSNLAPTADAKVRKILTKHSQKTPEGHRYVALKNIGILFEPQLQLNLANIFTEQSKNQTLIIASPGKIVGKEFLFYNDSSYKINLSTLTYNYIKQ